MPRSIEHRYLRFPFPFRVPVSVDSKVAELLMRMRWNHGGSGINGIVTSEVCYHVNFTREINVLSRLRLH